MKKILNIVSMAAACLVLTTSCIKEIDPQTGTVTKDQASNAPGSFDSFVTAITNSLTGTPKFPTEGYPIDYGYPSFNLMRDVMGQDFALEENGSEWYTTWYACGTALGPQYLLCQVPWTYYYSWIKSCNTVISLAGETPDVDKQSGAGIAYTMRAMFYFDLARMYSQKSYAMDKQSETVPLVIETTALGDLATNPRATNEVMYAQILSDLDKGETYLGNYKRSDKYTPDLSVVYGLKARVYLTMEDWANAEKYAKLAQNGYSVMTEGEFTSRTDGFNKPNDAWMFALTYKSTDKNILDNDGDTSWGSQMIIEVQSSQMGYGANYGCPKRIDYHLYQTIPSTDYRKTTFVDFDIDKLPTEAEQVKALAAYSDVPQGLYNTGSNTTSGVVGGLAVKFRPANGQHDNQYEGWTVAVPIMRVEEMKLIEAEAAGMQNEARGIELLTAFAKNRDASYEYGKHANEAYGSSYATPFQNEVWWQRRVEFWGEGLATYDIKRLNKEVIRSYAGSNHPESYRWNSDAYTKNTGNAYPNWMDFCIIQSETNYNAACTQNPTPLKPTATSSEFNW